MHWNSRPRGATPGGQSTLSHFPQFSTVYFGQGPLLTQPTEMEMLGVPPKRSSNCSKRLLPPPAFWPCSCFSAIEAMSCEAKTGLSTGRFCWYHALDRSSNQRTSSVWLVREGGFCNSRLPGEKMMDWGADVSKRFLARLRAAANVYLSPSLKRAVLPSVNVLTVV